MQWLRGGRDMCDLEGMGCWGHRKANGRESCGYQAVELRREALLICSPGGRKR